MPRMTIIRGLPGSGKSTLVGGIAEKNAIICSADNYFYDKHGNYNFDPTKLKEAHRRCFDDAIYATICGYDVIIDNTNIQNWQMAPYVLLGEAKHYDIEIVEVKANLSPEELAARNIHGVPSRSIERMANSWEPVLPHWKEYLK